LLKKKLVFVNFSLTIYLKKYCVGNYLSPCLNIKKYVFEIHFLHFSKVVYDLVLSSECAQFDK